jgi:hypothetical protein
MKNRRGGGMLGIHPYFDIPNIQDGRVVSSTRRPHFTPNEIPWYSFLLEIEWSLGLLIADRRNRSFENSKDPTGNRTRNLPSCSAVSQPTTPLAAMMNSGLSNFVKCLNCGFNSVDVADFIRRWTPSACNA